MVILVYGKNIFHSNFLRIAYSHIEQNQPIFKSPNYIWMLKRVPESLQQ